jgi:tetratricopeptide (TPR) repeat protein
MTTDEIRNKAASAVTALGHRSESKGRLNEADLPRNAKAAGWKLSGDDFGSYILPAKLREAVAYYDIAISIISATDPNRAFVIYTKALVLEQLGDYGDAAEIFASLAGGPYASPGDQGAERCRKKAQGSYDSATEISNAVATAAGKAFDAGNTNLAEAIKSVQAMIGGLTSRMASSAPAATDTQSQRDDADEDAAQAALHFVNLLLERKYRDARELLHSSLSTTSADDLRNSFEALFSDEEFPDSANVFDTLLDWPDKKAGDLASVYVTIDSENAEAVNVVVAREKGKLAIREIEWGRP